MILIDRIELYKGIYYISIFEVKVMNAFYLMVYTLRYNIHLELGVAHYHYFKVMGYFRPGNVMVRGMALI